MCEGGEKNRQKPTSWTQKSERCPVSVSLPRKVGLDGEVAGVSLGPRQARVNKFLDFSLSKK
jgi:hypothetical protein